MFYNLHNKFLIVRKSHINITISIIIITIKITVITIKITIIVVKITIQFYFKGKNNTIGINCFNKRRFSKPILVPDMINVADTCSRTFSYILG